MIFEVYGGQSQRWNFMRPILSNNIQFVSVCDNLDQGTKEHGIRIQTRDQWMKMEILGDQEGDQGMKMGI